MLHRLDASLQIDVVLAADGDVELPAGGIENYDGVTMTGSALNIYNGGEPVTRQIELAKAVFAAGVPFFGSCWGLQVAVTAAGGEVRANPRGREFGFARRIVLTDAGVQHRLFAGKPAAFEAPCVHRDEIARLPAGATVLAQNEFGVQAAAFTWRAGTFWGVQYHPEYDYLDIAAAAERYGETLVAEGNVSRRSRPRRFRRGSTRAAGKSCRFGAALEARPRPAIADRDAAPAKSATGWGRSARAVNAP